MNRVACGRSSGTVHQHAKMVIVMVLIATCLLHATPVPARTIRVPADQPTIAAGLDTARQGDSVLVAPGIYREWWLRMGPRVRLVSEQGSAETIIDGGDAPEGAHMLYADGVGPDGEISGFTLRNCSFGINAYYAGLTIRANVLQGFTGAIDCYRSAPTIESNLLVSCRGGINVGDCEGVVRGNTILGDGTGAGIDCRYTSTLISENLVVRCLAGFVSVDLPPLPMLWCNNAWNNVWADYWGFTSPVGINGNMSEDPLFCDYAGGDYHLQLASPCADPPGPCDLIGLLPVGCGVTATEPTTWGMLRQLFRRE